MTQPPTDAAREALDGIAYAHNVLVRVFEKRGRLRDGVLASAVNTAAHRLASARAAVLTASTRQQPEAGREALDEARGLIQEAKGLADGSNGGAVTDHLDFAEAWLDKVEASRLPSHEASAPAAWLYSQPDLKVVSVDRWQKRGVWEETPLYAATRLAVPTGVGREEVARVRVKDLPWSEPHPSHSYPNWHAMVPSIRFEARIDTSKPTMYGRFPLTINGSMVVEKFDTVEAAKAYAQAKFADRILSFLSHAEAGGVEKSLSDVIAEARKSLRLVQGCLECNADDERRWSETIEWLENLA